MLRYIKNIIETNTLISKLFDGIASTVFYHKLINSKITNFVSSIKIIKNYNVIIETTNICNARCLMCPHANMKRAKGIMKEAVFNQVVKKLLSDKIRPKAIILNGFGDPLTDGLIFQRVRFLKKNFPGTVVKFYTNLGLANSEVINEIFRSGLDEINISFNGYNKENYEKVMGIKYTRSLRNLEELIKRRRQIGSRLIIRISMALVSENDRDVKKFLDRWQNKVDSVSINKIHTYAGSVNNYSGKNKINYKKQIYPCKYIWDTITIGYSGDIYLCCLDFEGKYNFGNITKKKISEIFYSEEFEKIRRQHLIGDLSQLPICKSCYTPYKNGVEWLINNLF